MNKMDVVRFKNYKLHRWWMITKKRTCKSSRIGIEIRLTCRAMVLDLINIYIYTSKQFNMQLKKSKYTILHLFFTKFL